MPPLTNEDKHVIEDKGTEAPFSGKYDDFWKKGIFVCRRCGTPLYRSDNKFDAHCGWPAFDKQIGESVKWVPDEDGRRTEIQCTTCGAHLGHVFKGEGFTKTNTRHCVNSLSMMFIPKNNETSS